MAQSTLKSLGNPAAAVLSQQKSRPHCRHCSVEATLRSERITRRTSGWIKADPMNQSMTRSIEQHFVSRSGCNTIRATAEAAVETKVEPSTGVVFARQGQTPEKEELELLGAGVREKKIVLVNVKVYAVAFYVGDRGIHKLGPWRHGAAEKLKKDENFFRLLAEGDFDKQVQIVLARDVTGDQFYGALEEALAPRVAAAGGGSEGTAALTQFGDVFKGKAIKKGTGIHLTYEAPDTLHIGMVDDASTLQPPESSEASITSTPLVKALFDVFLGPDAVSPSLRESIAEGAAEFLA